MAFNDLVAQKIKDFEQQGVPQVFERDLDLGNPQEPKRDNIVHVIVGTRRCGKTYRLYQETRTMTATIPTVIAVPSASRCSRPTPGVRL